MLWLVISDWFQSWDSYNRWKLKREWYVIFRILRDALLLSLLRIPMTWFAFVSAWFIYFNHSKWSSKRTPKEADLEGMRGYIYPNTIKTCLTLNHLLFGRHLLYYSNTTSTVVRNLTILSSTSDNINHSSNNF